MMYHNITFTINDRVITAKTIKRRIDMTFKAFEGQLQEFRRMNRKASDEEIYAKLNEIEDRIDVLMMYVRAMKEMSQTETTNRVYNRIVREYTRLINERDTVERRTAAGRPTDRQ